MIPKNQRLSRSTFPQKKPRSRQHFSWGGVSLFDSPGPRVAVVVSKKTLRRAVDRNRARRRVFSALSSLSLPSGTALVVSLKKESLTVAHPVLVSDLKSVL